MQRRSKREKESSANVEVKNDELNGRHDLETDRQDRKDRDGRQNTRQNKTDSSSKTADEKTYSDEWARRHTVQYAKGKGRGLGRWRKGRRRRA